VSGSTGEAVAYRQKPDEGQYTADFGFEVGGPIMKDKLWFYAGFAPVISRFTYERYLRSNVLGTDPGGCPAGYTPDGDIGPGGQCVDANGNYLQNRIAGSETIETTGRDTYQYVGKLTYLINENNNLTLSAVGALGYRMQPNSGFVAGVFSTSQASRVIETDDPMNSVFAKYAGKFMDKRLIGRSRRGGTAPRRRPGTRAISSTSMRWSGLPRPRKPCPSPTSRPRPPAPGPTSTRRAPGAPPPATSTEPWRRERVRDEPLRREGLARLPVRRGRARTT